MITRLRINNFQAHKSLDLQLGKVTTLIGASDRGKSAILRALLWAATNKPGGDAYVTFGESKCKVGVEVDGHRIIRSRGPKLNSYAMDQEEYKSFNQDVPDPIKKCLALSNANVQRQMDPPFWLTLGPSELAKELNDVANMQLLTLMVDGAGAEVRSAKKSVDSWEMQEEIVKNDVDEATALIEEASPYVSKLTTLMEEEDKTANFIDYAKMTVKRLEAAQEKMVDEELLAEQFKRIERSSELTEAYNHWQAAEKLRKDILIATARLDEKHEQLKRAKAELAKAQAEVDKHQPPKECPTCHRPL